MEVKEEITIGALL